MKRVWCFFIAGLVLSISANAGGIYSEDLPERRIQVVDLNGARMIEACVGSRCELFPSKNITLKGFQGTNEEWQAWYLDCLNYEGLNRLYVVTDVLSSMLLAWNMPAVAFRIPDLAKIAARSRMTRYMMSFAISSAGSHVATAAKRTDLPFPEISKKEVLENKELFNMILSEKNQNTPIANARVLEAENVLRSCSGMYDVMYDREVLIAEMEAFNQRRESSFKAWQVNSQMAGPMNQASGMQWSAQMMGPGKSMIFDSINANSSNEIAEYLRQISK
jgi:hypothetical protein